MLYNGDCLEVMKDLSDNSIDLMFADLPYGQTSCKWDCLINLDLFWEQVNRICKINCPMFFTCSTKFGVSLINSNPKNFRYDLVWSKSTCSGFLNAKKMPMSKHEMLYIFYRKLPFYDLSSHTKKLLPPRKTIHYQNNSNIYGKIDRPDHLRKNGESAYDPALPNSVLEIKSQKGKHPTQKPLDLIKWCLKYYSKEGDMILDPTMGSGTTGVACNDMNRLFIGIELNEDIFKMARERILI
tara:strand:- start:146 stop:865 length:720 start_codon:yes stop_codon:yes gene_type:complete